MRRNWLCTPIANPITPIAYISHKHILTLHLVVRILRPRRSMRRTYKENFDMSSLIDCPACGDSIAANADKCIHSGHQFSTFLIKLYIGLIILFSVMIGLEIY